MLRALALVTAAGAVLCGPATARAATLVNAGGTLTYTAAAGAQNVIRFEGNGQTLVVTRESGDDDPIVATGCSGGPQYACDNVTRVDATAGDGNDRLTATTDVVAYTLRGGAGNDFLSTAGTAAATLEGGDGDDSLTAGGGASTLRGGAGADLLYGGTGDDFLDGGPDRDSLQGNGGADIYHGGDGLDDAFFTANASLGPTIPITVTLNGLPDDGSPGEGDNVDPDVENLEGASESGGGGFGTITLTGGDGPNRLVVTKGIAVLDGAGGVDVLIGGALDDTFEAVDGLADNITCNAGSDSVRADAGDIVAADCEQVQRVTAPPVTTPTPTPTPAPIARPAVRSFVPYFATRAALRGATLGRFEGIEFFTGLQTRSTVTLRCLSGCARQVRAVTRVGAKIKRAHVRVHGAQAIRVRIRALVVRRTTRIEVRVAHAGRRTRYVRYRFVRSGGELVARVTSRGILSP